MQQVLIAGDTLAFTTSLPDYPASAGWTLAYRLIPRTSGTAIDITTTADGDDHAVAESATTTYGWTPGEYGWAAWVSKAGERYTVEGWSSTDGRYRGGDAVAIKPDPATVASFDNRSHARKALDAIEAVLENRASMDQEEYAIAGRSLKRTPIADLLKLRDTYKAEVWRENAAAAVKSGSGNPRRIYVRFGRA